MKDTASTVHTPTCLLPERGRCCGAASVADMSPSRLSASLKPIIAIPKHLNVGVHSQEKARSVRLAPRHLFEANEGYGSLSGEIVD